MTSAVVYAQDLDRLVAFYVALDLSIEESRPGEYAVLTRPGVELSIVQVPKPLADTIAIASPPQARERTPIKLAFTVASIDGVLDAVGPLGGRVLEGARRWQFRGHAMQDAVDPEGNVYQLREPL